MDKFNRGYSQENFQFRRNTSGIDGHDTRSDEMES